MKRYPFATLLGLIALTAISVNAQSIDEAARTLFDSVAGGRFAHQIRCEVGKTTVSDRYPYAIAQGLVPKETTVYPVRLDFANLRGRSPSRVIFWRSDFLLFQDNFGNWRSFPDPGRPHSETESENDALITAKQRTAFENWSNHVK